MNGFAVGDHVKVDGRKGYWRIVCWWEEGEIAGVYGGPGLDPKGQRQHHAVRVTRLQHDTRTTRPDRLAAEHRAKKENKPHGQDR